MFYDFYDLKYTYLGIYRIEKYIILSIDVCNSTLLSCNIQI
jgi:hypothetical protein